MERSYIGRFAPSPTGPLHLGSLYAAVASFLQARSQQGKWLVRIDNLDSYRNVSGATDDILATLEAFGLFWDDSVFHQSQQLESYHSAIAQLNQQLLLYPCICTRKALIKYRTQNPDTNTYPEFCRKKQISEDQQHALRVKTENIEISFTDLLQGNITENLRQRHGDFILKRKDQIIAYQLAVVIDDQAQKVTEIVRGIDLLDSTTRQIYLQQKLGLNPQQYMHIPVIVDQQDCKLSKQAFATAVDHNAARAVLFKILNLLKQSPPTELYNAPVEEQLGWAVTHWNPAHLKKVRAIKQ